MAGARRAQQTARNFQPSVMFEGSDCVEETEGVKAESSLVSSVSACKKVLCSNSVLDSSEYWLKNEKTLCRVGFLEDQHEGGCTASSLLGARAPMAMAARWTGHATDTFQLSPLKLLKH
ncbi:hypothetical protein SRHO_G00081910 [Serrasalmus rhombeus]